MKRRNFWFPVLFLLIAAIVVHLYSASPLRVENNYSIGIYKIIGSILRSISGLFPFSFGDVLYGLVFIWLLWKIIKWIRLLLKHKLTKDYFKTGIIEIILISLSVYILFNILWGINYNRKGIGYQLRLATRNYTTDELKNIDSLLLQKVNESKAALLRNNHIIQSNNELFNESIESYKVVSKQYSFLTYKNESIKSSLWGWLGNYLGFMGYYDPFTGEAQVNTTIPYFLQPYTTCHEMAHQLGYAKEDEANFVGYLAASSSTDTLFHYSVYLDLFISSNRSLYMVDSTAAKSFGKQLLPEVKTDLKEWRDFMLQHNNPVEPIIRWLYGEYLEGNQQPSGILTYDEVTDLLIEYYKKTGKI
jgi:hypothetical protein